MFNRCLFFILSLFTTLAYGVDINFFGQARLSKSSLDNTKITYDGIGNELTFSGLEQSGVRLTEKVDDLTQAVFQVISSEDNNLRLDLLQINRNLNKNMRLRLGLQRMPNWLVSEHIQVAALYPWIDPPKELYDRMAIRSFNGASFDLIFDKFYATTFLGDARQNFEFDFADISVSAQDVTGLKLGYDNGAVNFFVSGMTARPEVILKASSLSGISVSTVAKSYMINDYFLFNTGLSWFFGDNMIYTEYASTRSSTREYEHFESAYFTYGRKFLEKFTLLATYSTDLDVRSTIAPSATATYSTDLNYQLNMNNLLKFSFKHVDFKQNRATGPFGETTGLLNMAAGSPNNFNIFSAGWAFIF
ncbi:MAG: hypothetical protein LW878_08070 [Proteobacteria bacterium]|nr:hypothetical protein [Pseudomonadota bacterium]